MATRYAETLSGLLEQIDRFRRAEISLDDLKSALWEAAGVVSSHEERALRETIQQAEGQLDMLQFTVSDTNVHAEALKVVEGLEARIRVSMGP